MITESIKKAQNTSNLLIEDLLQLWKASGQAPGITGVLSQQYCKKLLEESREINNKLKALLK